MSRTRTLARLPAADACSCARFVALLRAINVGGRNIIAMTALRDCMTDLGAKDVATHIQSGNVLFDGAGRSAAAWTTRIEVGLSERFGYGATVLLRSHAQLRAVVQGAPPGFGDELDRYRDDVLFLKEPLTATEAIVQVQAREGVDVAVAGPGVLYFSRLSALAAQSHLTRLVGMPIYKRMTIRNWRTTSTLLTMLDEREASDP